MALILHEHRPVWIGSPVPLLPLILIAVVLLHPASLPAAETPPSDSPATDTLLLDNGDRLTGTAVRLEDGSLTFETAWAGEITVDWTRVARLTTGEPARLVLADDTVLQGVVTSPEDGRLRVATERLEPAPSLDLGEVVALNPPQVPAVRLNGDFQLSLVSASGNTETANLILQGQLAARTERSRYTASVQLNEAEEDAEDTASKATMGLEYDYFFGERWYFETAARLTEDQFRDLNLRTTLGVAAGHQLIEERGTSLSLELGASWVNEDFILAPDESYAAARWTLDARYPVAPSISFFHNHEGLLSLEDGDDLLVLTRTGLTYSLFRDFVASTQLQWDWDNSPSPGREKVDSTLLLTLGYSW